ncbi:hypothetical protein BUE64_13900 [Corynebacterium diphtheriae subsp. lausannense]|nr:hypothetical protein BUE64_13900 [Corynebacterium diphtheriae subsp. lausannense]QBZ29184.1 hypothetical protein E4653_03800 [Corynebacterium diphtheriae subsp. lausannense]
METSHQPTSRGLPRPIRGLLVNQAPRTQTIGHSQRTYHRKRRQRALGKLTPIEYETIMEPAASLAA